ncbi:ankyrin repeat and MYND domain-containing protein 2 [Catharus ustulatus]|uniref:Ankyrin repeat and MYND domain-containing protein 2 n=1 Tax=Catharus ustulatus TaxID=91951 RepID=A0A8C3XXW7_CATUS|nr:ankyrin repeat and MYND domain-containing protein 2 [Catharus ustulatus]
MEQEQKDSFPPTAPGGKLVEDERLARSDPHPWAGMVRPAAGPGRAGLRAEGSVRSGEGAVPRSGVLRAPSRADPALPCAGAAMAPPRKGDLSAEEKDLLAVIATGNTEEAGRLLGNKNVRVNCLDEHGMTPLMHAAYKGKVDMCRLLLRHGADVNCNEHEHGYTALMFAGLSGNKEITWMMLEAGAETDVVNSVGRTAAQMAAFVGQHDCVTVINNFFPRERLDYYTKPQGLDKEPKLPVKLAGPLHKIITTTNMHPVKIVLLVKENPLLAEVEALQKCYRVLDLICEKCMKQKDMNEVLAMKMHYISCIFQKCITFLKEREDKLDGFIKSLLKGRDKDGFPVYQEKLIRESIRKFPYCEATLLQQLVRSIAPVEIGSDPTAFSVLTQAITGQVGFVDAEFCTTCGGKGADKRCSVCKMVMYCDQNCQKIHWFTHKKVCKTLKEIHEKQELEAAKEKRKQEKKQKKDETQPIEGSSTSEQQSDPGPDSTKEVDPNHPTDGTQEPEFTKEMEALALQPESPLESETALDDIDVQKIQDSEE